MTNKIIVGFLILLFVVGGIIIRPSWQSMRILFSILVFSLISCETTSGWITIEGKGLPDQDVTYKSLHFINKDTAYFGGSHIKLLDRKLPSNMRNIL